MEAYQPGQLILAVNPDAQPVPIPEPCILTRIQPQLKRSRTEPGSSSERTASTAPSAKRKRFKIAHSIHDADERSERTVFIGNVPTSSTKKTIRQLLAGRAEVESLRFRSASFSQPKLSKKAAFIKKQVDRRPESQLPVTDFDTVSCRSQHHELLRCVERSGIGRQRTRLKRHHVRGSFPSC